MTESGLAGARSPFLRHGAEQPVEWMPWGRAAFERARADDRPVLLDIGAVWCHWCHVMDRESYEDPDTAALINELYVSVKVDRDERPDVDARYQRAVQALTGQGGWPLTAFLTPDGEVFYGGTYFPPREAHGRPSFTRVLREVARIWREDRPKARQAARGLGERLGQVARAEVQPGTLDPASIDAAVDRLEDAYEPGHGGFGRAPKFPNAGALTLLLDRVAPPSAAPDGGPARRMLAHTLDAMARGGMYDQLGGGFHRYATDTRWLVPHFEKMAYDNGPLLELYARAASALGSPLWEEAAQGILSYYRDVAPGLVEEGGFPASQDADVDDDDGDYWTWTLDEVRAALDGDERAVRAATVRYGLEDPDAAMHLDPRRRVLFRAASVEEVATALDTTTAEADDVLRDVRSRLKRVRDARPRPYVDDTLYAGWVGLVASGHLAAARHLGVQDAGTAAVRALERVWSSFDEATGVARRVGDRDAGAYLQDQVFVARAMLDAHQWTQDDLWLDRATRLAGVMLAGYRDDDGFRDRPLAATAEVAALDRPARSITDSPEPAPDAVAVEVLARLSLLDGNPDHDDAARATASAFAGSAAHLATHAGTYYGAVGWLTLPVTTVVVVEKEPSGPLLAAALRRYRPRTVVRRFAPGAVDAAMLPDELRAMVTGDAPRAYLCAGRTCAAPVEDPEALDDLLREFGG